MNKYSVRNCEGIKCSVEADYLKLKCDRVIFYRTVEGKSDEFLAVFINPISVIREAE